MASRNHKMSVLRDRKEFVFKIYVLNSQNSHSNLNVCMYVWREKCVSVNGICVNMCVKHFLAIETTLFITGTGWESGPTFGI